MKRLKKMITSMMLVGVMSLGVGCSGESKNESLDVNNIKTKLTESKVLEEQSMDTPAKEHWMFDGVQDKIEDGFVSQAMINIRLQDVVVVKTTDTKAIVSAIENYKTNSLKMFSDGYGGDENITAVSDSKLEVVGDVVYFIATKNVSDVENIILGK
ncbi:MAG: DUF4358 domain-containing protein [Romboutsia sp.]